MKNIILSFVLALYLVPANAQFRIGIKAGPNFSDLNGDFGPDTSTRTSFHFGAVAELHATPGISLQPEVLYSSQGAKVDYAALKDIQYDYITVPVMVKVYLVSHFLDIEAGPQFSFLVHNNVELGDSSTFDFGFAGGAGANITDNIFLQARYVVGLANTSTDADVTNRVIQFSLGYLF